MEGDGATTKRCPQQSPQRSEVFFEGVFLSLNPRPHIYLGTPGHEYTSQHSEGLERHLPPPLCNHHVFSAPLNQWRVLETRPAKHTDLLDSDDHTQVLPLAVCPPSDCRAITEGSSPGMSVSTAPGGPWLTWIHGCQRVGSPGRPDPRSRLLLPANRQPDTITLPPSGPARNYKYR